MRLVGAADRDVWWAGKCAQLVDDGRFVSRIASLQAVVDAGRCVFFEADDGASWLLLSPCSDGSLFIEFVYSRKAGAVVRWLPSLRRLCAVAGYRALLFGAFDRGQARLFRRFAVGDGVFRIEV